MNDELKTLVAQIADHWNSCKATEIITEKGGEYSSSTVSTVFGTEMCWDNPNLVWVLNSVDDESYEEYGAQLGIGRTGRLMYEYQSHCSCDGFGDSEGDGDGEVMSAITTKTYEVGQLPKDWEKIVQVNCESILEHAQSKPSKKS